MCVCVCTEERGGGVKFTATTWENGDEYEHPAVASIVPDGYSLDTWKDAFKMMWMRRMGDGYGDHVRRLLVDLNHYLYAVGWTEKMENWACADNQELEDTVHWEDTPAAKAEASAALSGVRAGTGGDEDDDDFDPMAAAAAVTAARDMPPNPYCNGGDAFLAKFDADADKTFLWLRTFGSRANTSNGNIDDDNDDDDDDDDNDDDDNDNDNNSNGETSSTSNPVSTLDKGVDLLLVPTRECPEGAMSSCTVSYGETASLITLVSTEGQVADCAVRGRDMWGNNLGGAGTYECGARDFAVFEWTAGDGVLKKRTQVGTGAEDTPTKLVWGNAAVPIAVGHTVRHVNSCPPSFNCTMLTQRADWLDVDVSVISFNDLDCLPGTVRAPDRRSCVRCPEGTFAPDGRVCLPCPDGSRCERAGIDSWERSGLILSASIVPRPGLGFTRAIVREEGAAAGKSNEGNGAVGAPATTNTNSTADFPAELDPRYTSLDFERFPYILCRANGRREMPCLGRPEEASPSLTVDSCADGYVDGSVLCGTCEDGFARIHSMCMPCDISLGPGPMWDLLFLNAFVFIGCLFAVSLHTKIYVAFCCETTPLWKRVWWCLGALCTMASVLATKVAVFVAGSVVELLSMCCYPCVQLFCRLFRCAFSRCSKVRDFAPESYEDEAAKVCTW